MKPMLIPKVTIFLVLTTATVLAADGPQPLFNGKDLAGWRAPTGTWQVGGFVALDPSHPEHLLLLPGEGVLVNNPKGSTVSLTTVPEFGDVELHVEFCIPKRSNSGVYVMGRYEIQIYDSYGMQKGMEKDEYPGMECGGVYQRWINGHGENGHSPRVNASKAPGEWQSFDITFRAPKFDADGKKVSNAKFVKVVHNGKVIHENIDLTGPTRGAQWDDEKAAGPIMLQGDHGPVAYRNLRVKPSGATKPDFSKVETIIQNKLTDSKIPSISVAVARKGEVLWEQAFGWADLENRIPATEHTLYYTASVTKTFTETALMILAERNKLDLDRPVNDYLVGAKLSSPAWDPAGATVRRVANHTAGLTTFNTAEPLSMDEKIRRYGVLFWPPGDHFDYSNLGTIVLEEVIAQASQQPYATFLQNEICQPLGLSRVSVGPDPALEKDTARAYNAATHARVPQPKGGIYCNAHDLLRFAMFHLKTPLPGQKAILSSRSIDAMQNDTVDAGRGTRYGFSWWVEENRFGVRSVLSQGGTDAAQAWLRLIPSEGIAVVLLCNSGNASVKSIVDDIIATLLPEYAEQMAQPAPAADAPKTPPLPSPNFVGTWKGIVKTYRGDIPVTFSIPASGEVQVTLGSQPATPLNNPKFNEKRISGTIAGDLSAHVDGAPKSGMLELVLRLYDGALKGAAVSLSAARYPHWVELKKESGK
jgi:CubicO group peptidase (beta-lactamase class C family)